ncbi:MAG: putative 2OG-Fe(II) oxygenase [Parvularculaceae bacterium]|nr:putative 2OG-Fe(II) oxygenase [Parvularculaceae bacterium]
MPQSPANAAQDLIDRGDPSGALELLARAAPSADVFAARASAQLALGAHEAALLSAREARGLEPENAAALFNEGRALMTLGEPELAVAAFAAAERLFKGVADISARLGEAAFLAGADSVAEAALRRALDRAPAHALAFSVLADLLNQQGQASALDSLLRDAAGAGGASAFRAASVYARLGRRGEALTALARAEASAAPSTAIDMLAADVLREEGATGPALLRARAAAARAPEDAGVNAPLARLLLITGAADEAERLARHILGNDRRNQLWLAFLWSALAAQGSSEAEALLDFERDVLVTDIVPPEQFASIEAFNAALAAEVLPLHRSIGAAPLGQSVHGGSQTRQPLQTARSPALQAFFAVARDAAGRFAASFPRDASHPLHRNRGKAARISAAWSVALAPGGRHSAHVHPAGSVSSAYYIEAPARADGAGRLALGEPPFPVPNCTAPRRIVDPAPGRLALFPSYCWHGTTAFTHPGRRLTIAFDVEFF